MRNEQYLMQRCSKLRARVDGPSKIIKKIGENAYKVELPDDYSFLSTFNVKDLMTGPDPNTLPGSPRWSRLVKFHCTIPREDTVELHFKEGSKHMH